MILNHPQRCPDMFLDLGKFWDPRGPPGSPRGSERVSKEPNNIRHVGYQFLHFFEFLSERNHPAVILAPSYFLMRRPSIKKSVPKYSYPSKFKQFIPIGKIQNIGREAEGVQNFFYSEYLRLIVVTVQHLYGVASNSQRYHC